MSMILSLSALGPDLTDALLANPNASFELTMDPAQDERMAAIGHPINRMLGGMPNEIISLGKDWHALHFGLTKSPWGGEWPRNFLLSGDEIGGDLGYGPGKLIAAPKVADAASQFAEIDICAELKQISGDDFAKAEIYSFSHGGPIDAWRSITEAAFNQLLGFLDRAKAGKCSILIAMS